MSGCIYCESDECDTDCYACSREHGFRRLTAAELRGQKEKLLEAVRREAFVHGFIHGTQRTTGGSYTDEDILRMLPSADEAYAEWRQTRKR